MGAENSKMLGQGDIADRLVIPQSWMNILRLLFENGKKDVLVRVFCWLGYAWEFCCAVQGTGRYEKPTLQALEWKRFVNYAGLCEGDKIILLAEEIQERGTNYSLRTQRMDGNGLGLMCNHQRVILLTSTNSTSKRQCGVKLVRAVLLYILSSAICSICLSLA